MAKCVKCNGMKDVYTLLKCSHVGCSHCWKLSYNEHKDDFFHCFFEGCNSDLFDWEIRKILPFDDYKLFQQRLVDNPKLARPDAGWICRSCTFINLPLIKFCNVCQSNQPDDYEAPSYYKPTKVEEKAREQETQAKNVELNRLEKEEIEKQERLEKLKQLTKQEVALTNEKSECPICMIEYDAGEAIILHSCLHTICKDCFKNYLLNTDNPKMKCPTENCIGQIEDREIIEMLTANEFENYQQLSLRTAEATETLSFHCKAVNCTAWIVHDEYLQEFKCPLCKKENCIKCKSIHEGMNCNDYKRNLSKDGPTADALYFEDLIKKGEAMICSGCKCLVEKVKGCDWIRCKLCKTELCWATKGPRWGPRGNGDISGGCRCLVNKIKCHPSCHYCH